MTDDPTWPPGIPPLPEHDPDVLKSYDELLEEVPADVTSLFFLHLVEWQGAQHIEGAYAHGRAKGAEFTMDAMVTRWPVLEEAKRRFTEIFG